MQTQKIDNARTLESRERHEIVRITKRVLAIAQRHCGRRDARSHISNVGVDVCGGRRHRLSWVSWGTCACNRDHMI